MPITPLPRRHAYATLPEIAPCFTLSLLLLRAYEARAPRRATVRLMVRFRWTWRIAGLLPLRTTIIVSRCRVAAAAAALRQPYYAAAEYEDITLSSLLPMLPAYAFRRRCFPRHALCCRLRQFC